MIVWLARKASEAYEFGTFWENFEDRVAIKIPSHERADFAELFRQFCPRLMAGYVTPPEPGAFKHVEAFLFQAGLPLCHCYHFARLVQQVERRFGLPDPNAADAGEELRDHVLACSTSLGVPLLKRALCGPAGPLICGAALRVILQGNYQGISPQLGKALAEAFAGQGGAQLRRAARPPYLRLSESLSSLERCPECYWCWHVADGERSDTCAWRTLPLAPSHHSCVGGVSLFPSACPNTLFPITAQVAHFAGLGSR
jgi:hypothetical protein